MNDFDFKPDFVASHGHTIFHQPENYLTTQIGHPAAIKALTGIPVIADFRTTDVHLGGQGAPLVPIGDMLLFPEYSHCLNLGGIANISIKKGSEIIAFDICVTNMTLNYLAKINGQEYDENGSIAAAGKIIPTLLEQFITLDFHRLEAPKSLGKEWFDFHLKPLLKDHLQLEPLEDVMNTMCEGIAMLISRHLKPQNNVLVTGGGTFNSYLLKRITHLSKSNLNTHNTQLINYKEALIFGFLGVLRWIQEPNILSTVTGVERNHVSGCIYA